MARKIEYELLTLENNNIVVEQAVIDRIKTLKDLKAKIEDLEERMRMELKYAMDECGIDKYSNDSFSVTYVKPKPKRELNVNKLKEDGLYEKYSYEVVTRRINEDKLKEEGLYEQYSYEIPATNYVKITMKK